MGESSLNLGPELNSWIKLLRWDPGADPALTPNIDGPASGGAPLVNSKERQNDDPYPEVGPDPDVTSRELRWLKLLGQVEIRGRALSAGTGGAEGIDDVEEEGAEVKSLLKDPQLTLLELSTVPLIGFNPGARFRFRLRCRFIFKSSPVAEGRFPRLIEFLVAFFPEVLRLTLARFPRSDLQGVMLPPGIAEFVLRLSKAERD